MSYQPPTDILEVLSKIEYENALEVRIAALCRQHGVRELWSADRDFGRFPGLRVSNPPVSALVQ